MKTFSTFLFATLLTISCYAQNFLQTSIVSDGIDRSFSIQFPEEMDEIDGNLPIVFVLHGDSGTGAGILAYSGFAEAAIANNFISIFPDALNGNWNRAILGESPADDVLFFSDMIDYMCTNYGINRNRVYVTGHSAGAFMAYRLAIEAADKITAIAPVAGNMYGDAENNGNEYITNYLTGGDFIKIPILHIHGDADDVVAYPDTDHQPTPWSEYPLTGFSYPTCGANTYNAADVIDINANVKKIPYCTNQNGSKEISLIRIIGGGHGWPDSNNYHAAQSIWEFFSEYELNNFESCANMSIEEMNANSISYYPNPVNEILNIKSDQTIQAVQIYSMAGEIVFQQELNSNSGKLNLISLTKGVYIMKLIQNNKIETIKIIKN